MSRKRAPEFVDLTGDEENHHHSKHARLSSSQPSGSQPRFSQSLNTRDSWGGAEPVDNEDQEVIELSQDNEEANGWLCIGAVNAKVVGLRYYSGFATVGEVVMVRREPSNPYDSNAIRVNNVQGNQIGHIPRHIASQLAKYMVRCKSPSNLNYISHQETGLKVNCCGGSTCWGV
jgi:SWI/SNF-related matrix-associated actin-dependent regulator of chromatin subfamily A3